MDLAIIAGGKGTRFSNFSKKPKVLSKFGKKNLVDLYFKIFKENQINKIFFFLGHNAQIIERYIEKKNVNCKVFTEKRALGTAGCLVNKNFNPKGDLLVIMGDIATNFNVKKFYFYHKKKNSDITLFVHPNDHPLDSDIVNLDEDSRVIKFYSKNRKKLFYSDNLATAGIYLIKANILKLLKKNIKQDISKDLIVTSLKRKKRVFGYKSFDYVKDMGTKKRYFQVLRDLKTKKFDFKFKKKNHKAIFLDRDGVLNREKKNYKYSNPLDLYPGVIRSLKKINKSNYLSIVITNQPAIAKGFVTKEFVIKSHKILQTFLGNKNVYLNDIFFCPHHPHKGFKGENKKYKKVCNCRKPKNGLLLKAKKQYDIDFKKSFFIGNSEADYKAAIKSNIKPYIINNKILSDKIGQKRSFSSLHQVIKYLIK